MAMCLSEPFLASEDDGMQGGERSTTTEMVNPNGRIHETPETAKQPDGFNFHSQLGIISNKVDTLKPPTVQTSMKV
jgi:hypothetical protein